MAFPTVTRLIEGDYGYDFITHDPKLIAILKTDTVDSFMNWPLIAHILGEKAEEGIESLTDFLQDAVSLFFGALQPDRKWVDEYNDLDMNPWRRVSTDLKDRDWEKHLTGGMGWVDYAALAKIVGVGIIGVGFLSKISPKVALGLAASQRMKTFRNETLTGIQDILVKVSSDNINFDDIMPLVADFTRTTLSAPQLIAQLARSFELDDLGELNN